jgi:predicted SAM-dependent methyltransferase
MLKLDIGCGSLTRKDFIGVDIVGQPDVLCDIAHQRLPFEDLSVEHIYSSHCIEHIEHNHLAHVFQEITRVSADGGLIEIWHPHASHSDAFVLGHINYLSEALYDHLGCTYRAFWKDCFGAEWVLQEIGYSVDSFVLEDIEHSGMEIDFAISYLREVIRELGVFVRINRSEPVQELTYRRSVYKTGDRQHAILELSHGPRRQALPHPRQSAVLSAAPRPAE